MAIKINKLISKYNYNSGSTSRIKWIVIHFVGATGGAEANCKYFANGYRGASAHYFVGFDGEIWQSVEDKNIAWAVGAKSYKHASCRNSNSLSIEMCCKKKSGTGEKGWYFKDATVDSTVELTKYLMKKYGIDADHVIRHYDVTGKICPGPYVYNNTEHTWTKFKKAIKSSSSSSTTSTSTNSSSTSTTTSSKTTYIKTGQKYLNKLFNAGLTVDGKVGTKTKKALIKALQTCLNKAMNSKLTVDGEYGSKSKAVVGKVSIKKGTKSYMVTFVEIALYLKGYNPKGVEYPGTYGSGLEKSVKSFKKAKKLTVNGTINKALIEALIK